ncbi:Uncharacterized protein C5orf42, partial [Acanthisitta chloris]
HHRLTSKDIRALQKKKEEKDRALLSEHHSARISEALFLMSEMLSDTVVLPANKPLSRTTSPQVRSERSRVAAKPSFGHKVQRFTPALGLTQPRGKS